MAGKSHGKSRRKTPWDEKTELTPTARKGRESSEFSF